ncbi:MAG: hypothetical protein ACI8SE_001557 [Bacteroidia bacterium]|jgi:hypothetical protein
MDFKQIWTLAKPHLIAMGIFLVVFAAYFHPQLGGKVVEQSDILQGKGMIKESTDFHEKTGEYTLWTNAMFGGMPTYQISSPQNSNLIRKYVEPIMQLFLKAPISWFFVAAFCFYILMLVIDVNRWVAIVGGLAYALSTNNMILFAEGHTSKFRALSYLPLALAGVYLILDKQKYLKGAALFLLAMSLNIAANHYQMTYYFAIGMMFFMVVYFAFAAKNGELLNYFKGVGILLICGVLAVGPSFSKIYTTLEYSKDTMRGNSELKKEASVKNELDEESSGEGLDWDYAMRWSNNSTDMLATFIPGVAGGSSGQEVDQEYEVAKFFGNGRKAVRVPLYWGGGESTSGPVYYGAIVAFLMILGLVLLPNSGWKWGVFTAIIVIAFLSMGKYFAWFNELFFNYFPKYSIFRAHNSAMGVVSIFFPILGLAGLSALLTSKKSKDEKLKAVYIAGGVIGGLSLLLGLIGGGILSFDHFQDENFLTQYFKGNQAQYDQFIDALKEGREQFMKASAYRTSGFVLVAVAVLWAFINDKLKKEVAIGLIGLFIVIDLVSVDQQYLNEEKFISKKKQERPFSMRPVDQQIYQLETTGRGYYRVFDVSINTFSSSNTSYFHNTVGGYSAVKMARIQDVIDSVFRSERGIPFEVLDMMNAKYLIDQQSKLSKNPSALGNAWFIDSFIHVNSATDELNQLKSFNSHTTAIVHDGDFGTYVSNFKDHAPDSNTSRSIGMIQYAPNRLVYKTSCEEDEFVVFSEIWYGPEKGWTAYIDGEKVDQGGFNHIRANYLLRGMKVPAGEHEVVFEFKPQTFELGEKISFASSSLILLLIFGWLFAEFKIFKA